MISIIITAWEEPEETDRCIRSFLSQDIPDGYEVWVTCPDDGTKQVVMRYIEKYPKVVKFLQQPMELGKNATMDLLAKKSSGDIVIFTDGDVFVSKNSVMEIYKKFEDPKVGCVTGRPVSLNDKNTMLGYWSHLLTEAGAHNIRLEKARKSEFIECSGYLFAIRKGIVGDMPDDVAEDSIVPFMFMKKGYNVAYADKALVYVTYPKSFGRWVRQKVRSSKSHEMLDKYMGADKSFRSKSFANEALKGWRWALSYPENLKEFFWTCLLFPARLYVWLVYVYETRVLGRHYLDRWRSAAQQRSPQQII